MPDGARRDVGAADEDRSELRRVDVAELQLRAVGVTELAVLRRVAGGARRRFAPDGYAASPRSRTNLKALRGYFDRQHAKVSVLNQLMGLWASAAFPDLLTDQQRQATIDATFALQQPDGGWSTSSLGTYKRVDNTPNDTQTDGYATALATLALQEAGVPRNDPRIVKGLDWLRRNQDRATGRWIATSLNKQRDPESDPGKFMSDAATAFAVLALTYQSPPVTIAQKLDTPQARVYCRHAPAADAVDSGDGHATNRVLI